MKKPSNDKEFEIMVRDCAEFRFLQYFTLLGREGQEQYGGDVSDLYEKIIIQCKCYDQNKGRAAYIRFVEKIEDDYKKACEHFQSMEIFVAATTLDRDLPTQEAIHKIAGNIPIQIMFWEDIEPLYDRFEEKYQLKEIRISLNEILSRDRDNHPSFHLLQADKIDRRLFPYYEGYEFEPQTEENESISPIWSRVRKTWLDGGNRSVVIEGAGGIGKTVALFSLSKAKPGYAPAPAVYIPMYRLIDENGNCITLPKYFEYKFPALHSSLDLVTLRNCEDGPRLLLLLDGFNEIPSAKRRTVLRQVNDWRKSHLGAQLIVVSRPMDNLNLKEELTGDPIVLKLKPLETEQAKAFLADYDLEVPPDGPIWKILSYPLFLILYAKTDCLPQRSSSGYPLAVREAMSEGALIWNYLQRELLRDDREDMDIWVLRCAIACEYILPKIAYEMLRKYQFSIRESELSNVIDNTANSLDPNVLPKHLGELFAVYKERHLNITAALTSFHWIEVILQETGLLYAHQNSPKSSKAKRTEKHYSFIHQSFRDCLAGMYLINQAEMIGEGDFPTIWGERQSNLSLKYVAELIDPVILDQLWRNNQKKQCYSNAGYEKNHTATYNLLEVYQRNDNLKKELDFSGMDLSDFSLTRYLGKDDHSLPLFINQALSKETLFDCQSFMSAGHDGRIGAIAVLSDDSVVTGSNDCTLRIWDSATGQCIQFLKGHKGRINCISILPDGRIISGANDNSLKVWDSKTGKCLQTFVGHTGPVNCVACLPDGRVVSSGGGTSLDRMIRQSSDHKLLIWNPANGSCLLTLKGHSGSIEFLSVLSNGQVISGSKDKTLRIWDTTTGQCLHTLEGHTDSVTCVTTLPDGCLVSGSIDCTLRVWDVNTGSCLRIMGGHTDGIRCLATLPNGCVVSGSHSFFGEDCSLRVWDPTTGQCLKVLAGHSAGITCVSLLADGRIVSGSDDSTLRVWDVDTGKCLKIMQGHWGSINCVGVLSDGRIASGAGDFWILDKTARIWDPTTGHCLLTLGKKPNEIMCVSYLTGTHIASGSADGAVRIWDISTKRCVFSVIGHAGPVTGVSGFRNNQLITWSKDKSLCLWDITTGKCLRTFLGHSGSVNCATVLSTGSIISGASDCSLRIWDLNTGQCICIINGHSGPVNCIAVLPNGNVVSGSDDCTVRIWDSITGECLQTMHEHRAAIIQVDVSHNGKFFTLSKDNQAIMWDSYTGDCIDRKEVARNIGFEGVELPDGKIVLYGGDNRLFVTNGNLLSGDSYSLEPMEICVAAMNFMDAKLTKGLAKQLWENGAAISDKDYNQS